MQPLTYPERKCLLKCWNWMGNNVSFSRKRCPRLKVEFKYRSIFCFSGWQLWFVYRCNESTCKTRLTKNAFLFLKLITLGMKDLSKQPAVQFLVVIGSAFYPEFWYNWFGHGGMTSYLSMECKVRSADKMNRKAVSNSTDEYFQKFSITNSERFVNEFDANKLDHIYLIESIVLREYGWKLNLYLIYNEYFVSYSSTELFELPSPLGWADMKNQK